MINKEDKERPFGEPTNSWRKLRMTLVPNLTISSIINKLS